MTCFDSTYILMDLHKKLTFRAEAKTCYKHGVETRCAGVLLAQV